MKDSPSARYLTPPFLSYDERTLHSFMAVMENMTDGESLKNFLISAGFGYSRLELLAGDASARRYYRVFGSHSSRLLCLDEHLKNSAPESYPFFKVHSLLRDARVPVPEIYAVDAARGLILMQDLGDLHVEDAVTSLDETGRYALYKKILDILASIQALKGKGGPFGLAFDTEKLVFEFDFFIEHTLLGYCKGMVPDDDMRELRQHFISIARILDRPELMVLNHRDYHSRNILIHGGGPVVIDFQDARMGLPHYDLVSLIRDSYVVLSEDLCSSLQNYYYDMTRDMEIQNMGRDEFDYFFDIQAFQRNIKALGTFGNQYLSGRGRYESYMAPTLAYCNSYLERRPELQGAGKILKRYIKF